MARRSLAGARGARGGVARLARALVLLACLARSASAASTDCVVVGDNRYWYVLPIHDAIHVYKAVGAIGDHADIDACAAAAAADPDCNFRLARDLYYCAPGSCTTARYLPGGLDAADASYCVCYKFYKSDSVGLYERLTPGFDIYNCPAYYSHPAYELMAEQTQCADHGMLEMDHRGAEHAPSIPRACRAPIIPRCSARPSPDCPPSTPLRRVRRGGDHTRRQTRRTSVDGARQSTC